MAQELALDGSQTSGSGTLVRFSVALAAALGRPLRVSNARARRRTPGLRPQHVAALHAAAALCDGTVEGASVDARDFVFRPGPLIRGGHFTWDIGTAGSATMLALGVLPIACLATAPTEARILGGTHQDFAPSPEHLRHVLAPLLARMGARVELRVVRPGYVPGGAGELALRVEPARAGLTSLSLLARGDVREVAGLARASHLGERRVAERMAASCEERLVAAGLATRIEREDDVTASHAGAGLAVWAASASGARFGADRAGARRRSAESIGRFVAARLLEDLASGATLDRFAADQLVPFAALAAGSSRWRAPFPSEHLSANLWLAERFGTRVRRENDEIEVTGLGAQPRH
jgi:RNA 3'-terminal phosphate cyclase (ATP)